MEESIKEIAEAIRRLSWGDQYDRGMGAIEALVVALVGGDPHEQQSISSSLSEIAANTGDVASAIIDSGRDIRDGLFAVANAIKNHAEEK